MAITIYKIATIKDEDDIEAIKEYFGVDDLEDVDYEELGEYLAEEYHVKDIEDYKSFDCEEDELDSDEVGFKANPDSEDEGYLVLITPKSVSLRYFMRFI